jgi:hypothetical protein
MKKLTVFVSVAAFVAFSASCKSRDVESSLASVLDVPINPKTVQPAGIVRLGTDFSASVKTTNDRQVFKIISAERQLLILNYFIRTDNHPIVNQKPHVWLVGSNDPTFAIVSGELILNANHTGFGGEIITPIESGDYFLIVDHFGEFNGKGFTTNLSPLGMKAEAPRIQNFSQREITSGQVGSHFEMTSTGTGLHQLDFQGRLFVPSKSVLSEDASQRTCDSSFAVLFDENETTDPAIVDISKAVTAKGNCSFSLPKSGLRLATGKHTLVTRVQNAPNNSLLSTRISLFPPNESSQFGPPAVPLGIAKANLKNVNYLMKGPPTKSQIGLLIGSGNDEIKISTQVEITRPLNMPNYVPLSAGPLQILLTRKDDKVIAREKTITSYLGFSNEYSVALKSGSYLHTVELPADILPTDDVQILFALSQTRLTIEPMLKPLSDTPEYGNVDVPPKNYSQDKTGSNQPGNYIAEGPVKDVAARSVLDAMERVRAKYHVELPPGATKQASNVVNLSYVSSCLGNQANHWSDLQYHYYCQFGQTRSCYTVSIREKIGKMQEDLIRAAAFAECEAKASSDEYWKWLVSDQKDVFRYMMDSQTFAFNFAQQQEVINAFYRVKDPNNELECLAKRPLRSNDPTDGSHCRVDKVFKEPLRATGR